YLNFALGGYGNDFINNFVPFYGYDFVSIAGDSFVKTKLTLDYQLFLKHHLNFSLNYANVGDDIFGNSNWLSWPDYSGYAVGYGFESFLGPLEVKYTWSPEVSKSIWFFSLGFWF
ncbi:MAG: patatin, partial [Flavobacteriaceae bacterium]|nr:patatin [Flavobacteriaceae bacterium]